MPPVDHIDQIMALMAVSFDAEFGEAWTRRQVEDALVIGNCFYLLANTEGEDPAPGDAVAGFSLSRFSYDEEELLLFAVSPQFRRCGIGKRLLQRFAAEARTRGARRLLLEMRRGNSAESLYRGFGFAPIGLRPMYYRTRSGPRIDAITFACDLV
jgi:ribosomal-protein-alanine N-acetyltransferase